MENSNLNGFTANALLIPFYLEEDKVNPLVFASLVIQYGDKPPKENFLQSVLTAEAEKFLPENYSSESPDNRKVILSATKAAIISGNKNTFEKTFDNLKLIAGSSIFGEKIKEKIKSASQSDIQMKYNDFVASLRSFDIKTLNVNTNQEPKKGFWQRLFSKSSSSDKKPSDLFFNMFDQIQKIDFSNIETKDLLDNVKSFLQELNSLECDKLMSEKLKVNLAAICTYNYALKLKILELNRLPQKESILNKANEAKNKISSSQNIDDSEVTKIPDRPSQPSTEPLPINW